MSILKFHEEPTEVVFAEGTNGREVKSNFGAIEWRHFVNQNKGGSDTIFLPEQAQRMLDSLQPLRSETVLIWREKVGKTLEWRMQIKEPQRQPLPRRLPIGAGAPAAEEQDITPAPAHRPDLADLDGNAVRPAMRGGSPAPEPQRPEAKLMAQCLYAATDALMAAKQYWQSKRLPFASDAGDVRAMAISMYIEACKQRADQRRAA